MGNAKPEACGKQIRRGRRCGLRKEHSGHCGYIYMLPDHCLHPFQYDGRCAWCGTSLESIGAANGKP